MFGFQCRESKGLVQDMGLSLLWESGEQQATAGIQEGWGEGVRVRAGGYAGNKDGQ